MSHRFNIGLILVLQALQLPINALKLLIQPIIHLQSIVRCQYLWLIRYSQFLHLALKTLNDLLIVKLNLPHLRLMLRPLLLQCPLKLSLQLKDLPLMRIIDFGC